MKKKCTHCGSTNLQRIPQHAMLYCGLDTYAYLLCEQYVCLDCGHIELFAPKDGSIMGEVNAVMEKEAALKSLYDKLDKELADNKKNLAQLEKEQPSLETVVKKYEKLVADENISVKAHNEAEAKLEEAKKALQLNKNKIQRCKDFIEKDYDYFKNRIHEKGHR